MKEKSDEDSKAWFEEEDPAEEEKKRTKKQLQIDARRRNVVELIFLRGHTQQEAANILDVHVQTIKRDVKAIREEEVKSLVDVSPDTAIVDGLRGYSKAVEEAWYKYNSISDSEKNRAAEKQKYFELWQKAWKNLIDYKMEVGIIKKAPTESILDITDNNVKDMNIEELRGKEMELQNILNGETEL